MSDRKVFAGAQIRRFRKGLGLTQAQMAADLAVSASYLTLIERDQRPVSARVLLKLAETYDFDLRALKIDGDQALADALAKAAADPALEAVALERQELAELAARHPRAAEALVRLHAAYEDTVDRLSRTDAPDAGARPLTAADRMRQIWSQWPAHHPVLEAAAADIVPANEAGAADAFSLLARRLHARHGVEVQLAPEPVMGGAVRRYDRHARRVHLSHMTPMASRPFQLAYYLAVLGAEEALREALAAAGFGALEAQDPPMWTWLRMAAAKYMAAAMVMPYERFFAAAEAARYDTERIAARFGVSLSQAARRFTTLRRPDRAGPPFMMLRVDGAGHTVTRAGAQGFPADNVGAPCPRWIAFDGANAPHRLRVQLVTTADGARLVTTARLMPRAVAAGAEAGAFITLVLACPASEAGRWRDADGLDREGLADSIGPGCRRCERPNCPARAEPPAHRSVFIDLHHRGPSAFPFRAD